MERLETIRVTVDVVAFAIHQGTLEVLLIKRKQEPFKSCWALPGGFISGADETLEDAAAGRLKEETNVCDVYIEQLYTFGDRGRDPRGRVVTVSYLALIKQDKELELKASSNAAGVAWWPANKLPDLAFDHQAIITYGRRRLKYKIEYSPAAFKLLPPKFTLRDLQEVYEAVLDKSVDNRNFRKKFLARGLLQELAEFSQQSSFRPARLYAFSEEDFEQLPDRPIFVF